MQTADKRAVLRLQQRIRKLGGAAPDFTSLATSGRWSCVLTVQQLNEILNAAGVPAEPAA